MGLLGVPRASVGCAQARHHAHDVEQPLALLGGRDGAFGHVREQLVCARRSRIHRCRAHGVGEATVGVGTPGDAVELAVALGSVLSIATTVRVSSSNRPYFGFTSRLPSSNCVRSQSANTVEAWVCMICALASAHGVTDLLTSLITCHPNSVCTGWEISPGSSAATASPNSGT